jgi:methylglutaconyl-CoA hydratase
VTDRVLSGLADGVLTLTLNRPDKRNAIDTAMIDELHAALGRADLDPEVRAIALRGAGKDFCAGMDLDELLASAHNSTEQNAASAMHFGSIYIRMRDMPKPTVAVVQGRCLAGGMGLATGCDLVIAQANATFGYPEIQRGFVPAIVMTMLRRSVGEKLAFDLVATGRTLTASEAAAAGIISRVIPAEQFDAESGEFLRRLASFSPTALALAKRQFYAIDGRSFADSIRMGADVNALARSTPDFAKFIAQFLRK